MPHHVQTNDLHAFVEVVYHGEVRAAERAQAVREGAVELVRRGYRRAIVDLRRATIVTEPTHVLAGLVHDMADAPAVHDSLLAYVVTSQQESNRIIENMALARHVQVARFFDRDEAIAWLVAGREQVASGGAPGDPGS